MPPKKISTKSSPVNQNTELLGQEVQFVHLFNQDKNRLYAYIYALVTERAAADDIFQETCIALWKDFHKFEIGTSFSKWANGIAFNRVYEFRRNRKKYALGLSDDFLVELQEDIAATNYDGQQDNEKWSQLERCCELLPDTLKNIYIAFYVKNLKAQQIADESGRSIHAIRKAIHKLRQKLFECISPALKGDAK